MLNAFLGQEVFMNGVRAYLKAHQFQNAETHHLVENLVLCIMTFLFNSPFPLSGHRLVKYLALMLLL